MQQRQHQKRVTRATKSGWDGVAIEGYRPGDDAATTGVSRHTIVGGRKNDAGEPGPAMELRYFELQPGAASRLEKHEHEHYVVVRDGLGYAVLGDSATEIGPGDVIYVGPLELHQFVNRGDRPCWFLCLVESCGVLSHPPSAGELTRHEA